MVAAVNREPKSYRVVCVPVIIDGTIETVAEETRKVLDIMMPGGGYIGGASHDTILEETPVENVVAMFDTIREYGQYH